MVTIRDIVDGYRLVNEWESQEEKQRLPRLTVTDSLRQYFELKELACQVAPDSKEVFQEERLAYWHEWRKRVRRATRVMIDKDDSRTTN